MSESPRLLAELEACATSTLERQQQARPENTVRAYSFRQVEFMKWCDRKGFREPARHEVTTDKLRLF